MTKLADKTCIPCQGDIPPLSTDMQQTLLQEIHERWTVEDGHHLLSTYTFPNFVQALAFTNAIGEIAEYEGHHPDILLSWGKVSLTIRTHKIDGLTEGDFVLAAKIDRLFDGQDFKNAKPS